MSAYRFTSSRACSWNEPRPFQDASMRLCKHGPVLPMQTERRGIWAHIIAALKGSAVS
jgi:hypothetical protein